MKHSLARVIVQPMWSSIDPSHPNAPIITPPHPSFVVVSCHNEISFSTISVSCVLTSFFSLPVWLVQCLESGDQDVLVKSLKKPPECSLKRAGLRAVSLLLRDPRGKVCSAASSLLRSLADQTRHRERVRCRMTVIFL